MKSPEDVLKRWLHPAVFATWTVFLGYLLVSQRYVAFLRPEFGILLVLAHFIAMGFMLAAMFRTQKTILDTSAVLRALVLLIPVLFFMIMPDTMLGNQAFKKRFIGTNNGAVSRRSPSNFSDPGRFDDPEFSPSPEELKRRRQAAKREQTILDLYLKSDSFKGQRVVFTGMILRDEELKSHFGGKDTAVYRFLITCCAADALPLAIALDSDQADAFAKDSGCRWRESSTCSRSTANRYPWSQTRPSNRWKHRRCRICSNL